MCFWKKCVTLLVAVSLSWFAAGCRKEKADTADKETAEEKVKARSATACEKAVRDYLDAVAAGDYRRAVEFLDVEEMVNQRKERAVSSSVGAEQMKEMLISMMEKEGEKQIGELSYEIAGSEVTGDKAIVDTEIYRDAKLVDRGKYALTRRDGRWKLRGSAIRALFPPIKGGPSTRLTQ